MMDELDLCDATSFRNADWLVGEDGLAHRRTGYFISAESIARKRAEGLWDWPLHMAEKNWCTPSLFREAFLAALDRYGVARDAGLSESFALGFGIRAGRSAAAETGFAMLGDLVRPRTGARRGPAVAAAQAVPARAPRRVERSAARV